jgi:Cd2+/Zn2+-exporting ATPase
VAVGSPEFIGVRSDAAGPGRSVVSIAVDGVHRGDIVTTDSLRPESAAALRELKRNGVVEIVMLTGDVPAAAEPIGRRAGVDVVHAGLLPAEKNEHVRALQARHGGVAMVGDGINDAPALAAATVGVAMGAGAAQAMETADVTLMGDDLLRLPFARTLAQQAMRTVRASIVFAVVVKAAVLALVLVGQGTLWLAVAADVGAALLVIAAGMRLLRIRPRRATISPP